MFTHFSRFPRLLTLGLAGALLTFGACKKDDDDHQHTSPKTTNELAIELEHRGSNDSVLVLQSKIYTDSAGERYTVDTLKYYVSNVQLTRADGTIWQEPNSYHLVKVKGAPNDNPTFTIPNVPLGNYTKVTFAVGVDAIANGRTDHVGDLNHTSDMAWDWNTGYKFMKLEGRRVLGATRAASDPKIIVHPGTNALYRPVTLPLPTAATVTSEIAPEIHLAIDVNTIFGGPNVIRLGTTDFVLMGGGPNGVKIADNYARMFSVEHIHNDPHQH